MNMNMNIVKQPFISFRDQRLSIRIHFKNQKLDEPEIRVSLNIHTYIITTTLIPIRSIPLLSPPLYTHQHYIKNPCMHACRKASIPLPSWIKNHTTLYPITIQRITPNFTHLYLLNTQIPLPNSLINFSCFFFFSGGRGGRIVSYQSHLISSHLIILDSSTSISISVHVYVYVYQIRLHIHISIYISKYQSLAGCVGGYIIFGPCLSRWNVGMRGKILCIVESVW